MVDRPHLGAADEGGEMRRFAQDTAVPVTKSRSEIDVLLREWGANAIQWSDDFETAVTTLRFIWTFDGLKYLARFNMQLPSKAQLAKKAIDGRTGRPSPKKLEALMKARGKSEHRLLLLWLKAALNAVASGMVTAEMIFLPFMEGNDGRTMGEIAVPRMAQLLTGSAARLLGSGPAREEEP
jgi:hypothetical protein